MLVWRKGNIKKTVCVTVLCTIIMVHKGLAVFRVHTLKKNVCLHPSLYLLVSWAWWDWPL